MSSGPKTPLDVIKVAPRVFATVPTKHFGIFFVTFWRTVETKIASKDESCFRYVFRVEISFKLVGF